MPDFEDAYCPVAVTNGPRGARPVKILAIDDDPNVTKAFQRRFAAYGVEVLQAFHGMQGMSLAVTEKPDLIITDLVMPHSYGQGDDVVQCLKGREETRGIPIIVLTGQPNGYLKRQLRNLGADAYLTKPVDFEDLLELVGRFINLEQPE